MFNLKLVISFSDFTFFYRVVFIRAYNVRYIFSHKMRRPEK